MNPPLHVQEINRARDYYNPLRGLDIPRVVHLFEQAERGRFDEIQKLNRAAEKRHPTLLALKTRRLGALKKLDWDVKVPDTLPAGVTAQQAEAQRVYLRSVYEGIENLPQAVEFLAKATFRGFAHLEKRYLDDKPGNPLVRLNPVPQWHWLRDPQEWDWRYDALARYAKASAVPIDPADFIIREVEDPLCEIALLCFIRRVLAKRNWTAFQQDYAIPSIFAMLGENTPLDKVAEWLELVKKVTNNSRGALPPGSSVETLEAGKLDGVQFQNFIDAEDRDLVLAGTGGLLTMLTAPTGLNSDQGGQHGEAFDTIAEAEAAEITALFQAQLDKPELEANFPGQRIVAYFELAAEKAEDVAALADTVAKFAAAGLEADADEVSEKANLTLTRKVPPALPVADPNAAAPVNDPALKNRRVTPAVMPAGVAAGLAAGREARFLANSERLLREGDLAALKPLLERAAALDGITDPEAWAKAFAQLQADLPALQAQCLGDAPTSQLEDAFDATYGAAMASGFAAGAEKRPKKAAKTPEGVSGPSPTPQNRS